MTPSELDTWLTEVSNQSKQEAAWLFRQSRHINQHGWDSWWTKTDGPAGYNEKI